MRILSSFFKVSVLFGKGAQLVGRAGLLDRTVAELTDAPDRRGERGWRLPALNQNHPFFWPHGTSVLVFPSTLKRDVSAAVGVSFMWVNSEQNTPSRDAPLLVFHFSVSCLLPAKISFRGRQPVFVFMLTYSVSYTVPHLLQIWFPVFDFFFLLGG